MIQIAYPWLFAVVILPFIGYWLLPKSTHKNASALKVPFFNRLLQTFGGLSIEEQGNRLSWLKYLWLIIWVLIVISASGIEWLGKPLSIPQSGRDLLMAVDLSGSMETPDMVINGNNISRIDMVKQVGSQFINNRVGDRLGLILFGSRPYLQTPLTFDRKTVAQMLDDATLGIAGPQTAIGDAIGLAVKRLLDYPSKSKALILLTDGGNNAGVLDPLKAAELAKEAHIKIYTIGIGATSMQVPGLFGSRTVNPSSDLDIDGLRQIAAITGGEFFRAEDVSQLQSIYGTINQLEPIKSDSVTVRPVTPLYPWTLGVALLLSYLCILLKLRSTRHAK